MRIKTVGRRFTETTRAQFSTPAERWVPEWDARAAAEQKMVRVAERRAMGRKMTPIGAGKLRP